jgi:hypothetical protein
MTMIATRPQRKWRRVRWVKWFGERLLWALLPTVPLVILAPGCVHEVDFHWHARLVEGKVIAYGVDAVADGGGGRHGSYTTVRQWPWLDAEPLRPGDGPACRIDSQTRIFGDVVSTDPAELKRRLARLAGRAGFAYYVLPGATPAEHDCRMFKRTDPYWLLVIAFIFMLAVGLSWIAWSALDDPEFQRP